MQGNWAASYKTTPHFQLYGKVIDISVILFFFLSFSLFYRCAVNVFFLPVVMSYVLDSLSDSKYFSMAAEREPQEIEELLLPITKVKDNQMKRVCCCCCCCCISRERGRERGLMMTVDAMHRSGALRDQSILDSSRLFSRRKNKKKNKKIKKKKVPLIFRAVRVYTCIIF